MNNKPTESDKRNALRRSIEILEALQNEGDYGGYERERIETVIRLLKLIQR